MTIIAFPPVTHADRSGLLAVGGDLEEESLLLAYQQGIFPWPLDDDTLAWFAPPQRAVLFLEEFHISRKLRKERSHSSFSFSLNRSFREVVTSCAESTNRGTQKGTWITAAVIEAYCKLFQRGFALSAEAWDKDGRLAGGLYGVRIGRMFAGESMFYHTPGASKQALCWLVEHLKAEGVNWIDCQIMTPLFESFGARLVSRSRFNDLLKRALENK